MTAGMIGGRAALLPGPAGRGQLRALVRLRWSMVRSPRRQAGLALLLAYVPGTVAAVVTLGASLPSGLSPEARVALPTMLFVVLAVSAVAPLAAGGATELFPPSQLVAFPVSSRTRFAGGLLLMPLNLAWLLQCLTVLGLGAYASADRGGTLGFLVVLACFLAMSTVLGQALSWLAIGARAGVAGRAVTAGAAGAAIGLIVWLVWTGRIVGVADRSPLVRVVTEGLSYRWEWAAGLLAATAVAAYAVGVRACGWAIRRSAETSGTHEARSQPRRRQPRTPLAALVRTDRASVLRSTPIRRGLAFLIVVPPLATALAGLTWNEIVIVPGLVAAGAGLLFGINAFALDGGGALWLASSPHDHALALAAKARVLAETCFAATLVAVLACAVSAQGSLGLNHVVALVGAALGGTSWVVATCLVTAINHPHRADMRGPRDAPAPPGAMTAYSARLAAGTTTVGLALTLGVHLDSLPLVTASAALACALAARKVAKADRLWAQPEVRARVVTTVAAG